MLIRRPAEPQAESSEVRTLRDRAARGETLTAVELRKVESSREIVRMGSDDGELRTL